MAYYDFTFVQSPNTPPEVIVIPMQLRKYSNFGFCNGFVSPSAICSSVLT